MKKIHFSFTHACFHAADRSLARTDGQRNQRKKDKLWVKKPSVNFHSVFVSLEISTVSLVCFAPT